MYECNSISKGRYYSKPFRLVTFFHYLKKSCLKIQQVLPKYFMVGLDFYHRESVFRYRVQWELQRAISQVHECSAQYKLNLQAKALTFETYTWFLTCVCCGKSKAADFYKIPHAFIFRFAPDTTFSFISCSQEHKHLLLWSNKRASAGKFVVQLLHIASIFHIIH